MPDSATAPGPNPDLPDDVKADYLEARSIASRSPRAAAALLRLAVQKLCIHLGLPGKNLNADIAALVKDGLSPVIQKALDVVRVVGNNAVHPGEMDLEDDSAVASALFGLVNAIGEARISQPRQIEALFSKLPAGAIEQIQERDANPNE